MRHIHRVVLLAGLVMIAPVLAGCADFDMDKLDVFGLSEKKKLPGDRKAVFPQGVPGVTQGIPPEFIKSNQPPLTEQDDQTNAAGPAKNTIAAEPVEEPKPKLKPKPKPKPRTVSQPPAQMQPVPQAQPAPWPTQGQQQQAPGQSTSSAPVPSSPGSGTFTR